MPTFKLGRLGTGFVVTWIDERGVRRRMRTGADNPSDAEAFRQRLIEEQAKPKDRLVSEIIDWRLAQLEGKASHKVAIYQALPIKAAFGSLYTMSITKERQLAYVRARSDIGRKPATIRSEMMFLATALQAAKNEFLIGKRPHIFTPQDSQPREHYLTREQARLVLDNCPTHHVRLFIRLGIATGARMTALLELTWDRVNFETGLIDLRKTRFARMKGRAVVHMGDGIREYLKEARMMALTDHVIEFGGKPLTRINKGVKEAGRRAGMPWLSPHVLRHTSAVWSAEAGHSMPEIAAMLGHKDSRTTERVYARYSPDHLRKISASLEI